MHGTGLSLAAGLAAGFVHFAVNSGFVAVVIRLSDRKVSILGFLRSRLWVLPIQHRVRVRRLHVRHRAHECGAVGFMALLAPVIVLHVYLILFAQGTYAHAQQAAAFQKEREELLRKEAEASERERDEDRARSPRRRGAEPGRHGAELSAEASQLKANAEGAANGTEALSSSSSQSATDAREAMKDLRTLIIDLAPPTLRREGLQAALLEVLARDQAQGNQYRA